MLSTELRKRCEYICNRIANNAEVQLEDIIFVQKLAKANHSADAMLRRARREANRGEQPEGGLDAFLDDMDLGEPDSSDHLVGSQDPDSLANWFTAKRKWFVDDEGFRD